MCISFAMSGYMFWSLRLEPISSFAGAMMSPLGRTITSFIFLSKRLLSSLLVLVMSALLFPTPERGLGSTLMVNPWIYMIHRVLLLYVLPGTYIKLTAASFVFSY